MKKINKKFILKLFIIFLITFFYHILFFLFLYFIFYPSFTLPSLKKKEKIYTISLIKDSSLKNGYYINKKDNKKYEKHSTHKKEEKRDNNKNNRKKKEIKEGKINNNKKKYKKIIKKISANYPKSNKIQTFSHSIFFNKSLHIYGYRNKKGKIFVLKKYGGSLNSINCVELGLKWLKNHQDEDGKWSADKFNKNCKDKVNYCWGKGYSKYTPAVTGLAFLSFLGAGYTPTKGKYKYILKKTKNYLLSLQDKEGFFCKKEMYGNAIILLSLVELYSLSKDIKLGKYIRKAILSICKVQQDKGGWTYEAYPLFPRNDISVTGWQILALIAAKNQGFYVSSTSLTKAYNFINRYTFINGYVRYADIGFQCYRKSKGLIGVSLLCNLLFNNFSNIQKRQVLIILNNLPSWEKVNSLDNSMYYWYHSNIAMFIIGGKYWQQWNSKLSYLLINHQIKEGEAKGSWDPIGKWGKAGGRVYSTAINILNLEIYYRYNFSFLRNKLKK